MDRRRGLQQLKEDHKSLNSPSSMIPVGSGEEEDEEDEEDLEDEGVKGVRRTPKTM